MHSIKLTEKQEDILRTALVGGYYVEYLKFRGYLVVNESIDATHIEPKLESFVFDLNKFLEYKTCKSCGR